MEFRQAIPSSLAVSFLSQIGTLSIALRLLRAWLALCGTKQARICSQPVTRSVSLNCWVHGLMPYGELATNTESFHGFLAGVWWMFYDFYHSSFFTSLFIVYAFQYFSIPRPAVTDVCWSKPRDILPRCSGSTLRLQQKTYWVRMQQLTAAACHGLTETEVLDRVHESPLLDSPYDNAVHFTSLVISVMTIWAFYFLTYSLVCQGRYSCEVKFFFFSYFVCPFLM
jgi:hypothetical protein